MTRSVTWLMLTIALGWPSCALAQPPEADGPPYAMDTYYVAFLKRGPRAASIPATELEALQAAHMASIGRQANEGKLIGAGPLLDDGELRGLFIYRAASLEQAKAWAAEDPSVQAGRLAADVFQWFGPKGIGEPYRARMAADPASKPRMRTFQLVILKKGARWREEDTPELRQLQRRHLGYITQLTREGTMPAAGPLSPPGDWRGIAIYATASVEEARTRAEADPAVRQGLMAVEAHPLMMDEGVLPAPPG